MGTILNLPSEILSIEARRESFYLTCEEHGKNQGAQSFAYASNNIHGGPGTTCGHCEGTGNVPAGITQESIVCGECHGTGREGDYPRTVTMELLWTKLPELELAVQALRSWAVQNNLPVEPQGQVAKQLNYDTLLAHVARAVAVAFPDQAEDIMRRLRARSRERIKQYARHADTCWLIVAAEHNPGPRKCSCGLNNFLRDINGED